MQQFHTSEATPGGLTVLLCIGKDKEGREHTASKRYAKNGHGFKKVSDYNMGWQFDALPFQAESLPDIADLIGDLRSKPQAVIVRGELDAAYHVAKQADPDYLIRRRKRDKGDGVPVLWIGDVHEFHVVQLVGGELLHAIARAVVENVPEPRAPRPRPRARRGKR